MNHQLVKNASCVLLLSYLSSVVVYGCYCILCKCEKSFTCADKKKVYSGWLKDRYSDCCNALCTLICHENTSVQVVCHALYDINGT